jgi:hypothetical protein
MTGGANQEISPPEIAKIRALDPFDLVMLINEIHDHGWPVARETLRLMPHGTDVSIALDFLAAARRRNREGAA